MSFKIKISILVISIIFILLYPSFGAAILVENDSVINQNENNEDTILSTSSLSNPWSNTIDWPSTDIYPGTTEPVVCDLNNDGFKELVMFFGGNPSELHVYDHQGNPLIGWPQVLPVCNKQISNVNMSDKKVVGPTVPSIIDIDNDGYMEILVVTKLKLIIYNHDGSINRIIYPSDIPESNGGTCCMIISYRRGVLPFDLDDDGNLEIMLILQSYRINGSNSIYGEYLTIIDLNGDTLTGWPIPIYDTREDGTNTVFLTIYDISRRPSVGNFDNDPDKEIVMFSIRNFKNLDNEDDQDTRVYIFNKDGTNVNGFPIILSGTPLNGANPSIADVNLDGYDEIAFRLDFKTFIIDRFGNTVQGWPKLHHGIDVSNGFSTAIGNFNDDTYPEIVVGGETDICIYTSSGSALKGWPVYTNGEKLSRGTPIIADLDGDKISDVLVNAEYTLYAWNNTGELINGFPITLEGKITDPYFIIHGSPIVEDIDNDEEIEIIVSTLDDTNSQSILRLIEINQPITYPLDWPMFRRDIQHTGLFINPLFTNYPPGIPDIISGPNQGEIGKEYSYEFVSDDPDDDLVKYYIDWGDGKSNTTLFYSSNNPIIINHTWLENKNYTITIKSIDEHGAESSPVFLEVTISKSKTKSSYSLYQKYFERHPLICKIIQKFQIISKNFFSA